MYTQQTAQWLIEHGVFFDTETTGLADDDQVIEIAAVDGKTGRTLINTLVYTNHPISEGAANTHHITPEMLQGATDMDQVMADQFIQIAADRPAVAFNLPFDRRMISQSLNNQHLDLLGNFLGRADHCAMQLANRHLVKDYGEWNEEHARFKRLSLRRCCEIAGVEFIGDAHRAEADARATRDLIKKIADGEI